MQSDAVLLGQHGNIREALAVVQDITERKKLEEQVRHQAEAVQQEYEKLAGLVSSVDVAISLYDTEGRFTLVNEAWLKMSGLEREQVLGKRFEDLGTIDPGLLPLKDGPDVVLSTGQPVRERASYNKNRVYPEGAYFDRSLLPMRDANGEISGVLGAAVDVTDKVRALEAVEGQRAFLENIIEGVPVCIAYCDADLRVIDVNTNWARLTGRTPDEVRDKKLYDAFPAASERSDFTSGCWTAESCSIFMTSPTGRPAKRAPATMTSICGPCSTTTAGLRAFSAFLSTPPSDTSWTGRRTSLSPWRRTS